LSQSAINISVEKSFSHTKPHLEPFFSRSEEGTRARMFLTVLGYTFVAIIACKCGIYKVTERGPGETQTETVVLQVGEDRLLISSVLVHEAFIYEWITT